MDETKQPDAEQAAPRELSLADALALAINLHRADELADAELLYRRILDASPDNADALHFLGILLHHRGRSVEAIRLIERSIVLLPGDADRYNNLGNVLIECGRLAEATAAYRKALELTPEHPDAWNNFGALLRVQGRLEEAEAAYLKAIELAPANIHAYNNYGNLLAGQKRAKEAVGFYCKAITLAPGHANSMRLLGIAYYTLGQVDAAAEVYRKWLEAEPDDAIARHMLASCSGEEVPERASDAFITQTFDSFAKSFDQKLESLSYRAPQLVVDAVGRMQVALTRTHTVLDAGCGTGLCGPLIAPYAARLVGVDLSPQMLVAAKRRNIYNELVHGELGAYLDANGDTFDLVISADTLVYFGELQGVFVSVGKALRPGGLLVFTVEELGEGSGRGYALNPHGRYSHRPDYLMGALERAGFLMPTIEKAVLRMESGNPVAGLVVAARLP